MAATAKNVENSRKRERGPNYTEAERENLMSLAKRYTNIIEDKSTGTTIFQRKAEAWKQLAKSYNASATTGIRTPEQLKHSYDNMKQKARKVLASTNKAKYLHILKEKKENLIEVSDAHDKYHKEEDLVLDIAELKSLEKSDKIGRKKTGGGSFTPAIQDKDLKILELIKEQAEPLSCTYDSAAEYFNDNLTQETQETAETVQFTGEETEENMVVYEIITGEESTAKTGENEVKAEEKRKYQKGSGMTKNEQKGQKAKATGGQKAKATGILSGNIQKSSYYKNLYFKNKYQNSILERRRHYQELRLRQKEHLLLAKKLKLEISILEKQLN